MEEKLNWLDQEYLCHFDKIQVDSRIPMQKPFDHMIEKELPYSIASDESEADNTYLSYNKVIGTQPGPGALPGIPDPGLCSFVCAAERRLKKR